MVLVQQFLPLPTQSQLKTSSNFELKSVKLLVLRSYPILQVDSSSILQQHEDREGKHGGSFQKGNTKG